MQRRGWRGEALIGGATPKSFCAREDAGQRVVVARGDGVVFVIVAPRAGDAKAHHCRAHHVDLVRHHVHREIVVHCLGGLGAEREETGGDEMTITLGILLGGQEIAGDLLREEAVVRRVSVEGVDHVIAITPRVWKGGVAPETVVAV